MKYEFSPAQREALRMIADGSPPRSVDGRSLRSLRINGFVDASGLTAAGREVASASTREIRVQPPSSLTPAERESSEVDWSMLAVCCEALESAVAAGVLVGARGRLYLRAGTRAWYVDFCPWCGEKRA